MEANLENKENQEMEEIIHTGQIAAVDVINTPEESTYTLSSTGTEGLLIGPTIRKPWACDDEEILTSTSGNIPVAKTNGTRNINGGLVYNSVPTTTQNGGNESNYCYGFPRSTAV